MTNHPIRLGRLVAQLSQFNERQLKAVETAIERIGAGNDLTEHPSTEHPSTEHPSAEHPSAEQPSAEHPSDQHPSDQHPSAEQPSAEHPSTEHPSTEHPSTEHPSAEQPSAEQPSAEQPSAEHPSTEHPSTEHPSAEQPSAEHPSAEQPSTEQPSAEHPSAEHPSAEQPSTEQPSTEPAAPVWQEQRSTIDWPRAPVHRLSGKGTFVVTVGTLDKVHYFCDTTSLDYLQSQLLKLAVEYEWQLEAWSVFSNHYHFVGHALQDAESLSPMLMHLHSVSGAWINARHLERHNDDRHKLDLGDDFGDAENKVWHNFWETRLTYHRSYLARLKYVHCNAVKHGLVKVANQYPWCSAGWFERTASAATVKSIYQFSADRLNLADDYEPLLIG